MIKGKDLKNQLSGKLFMNVQKPAQKVIWLKINRINNKFDDKL